MDGTRYSLKHLTDSELEAELHRIVTAQRLGLVDLLSHLAEVDERKLYLRHACASLFTYCTSRLGFSEDETYKRTQAARAARSYPVILTMLAAGQLHFAAVTLLAPHLTPENHRELLEAACGKSKRVIEELIAARWPRPDAPTLLRREPAPRARAGEGPCSAPAPAAVALPLAAAVTPGPRHEASPTAPALSAAGPTSATPTLPGNDASRAVPAAFAFEMPAAPSGKRPVVEPLSASRYKLQVTLSRNAHDTLLRLQRLMRHSVPNGDLSIIIEKALTSLCELVEARRPRQAPGPT